MRKIHVVRNRHYTIGCLLEALESRVLLDGSPLDELTVTALDPDSAFVSPVFSTDAGSSSPSSTLLTPKAIRNFYGFNGIAFNNGTVTGDGSGQTIAIIDWGNDPNIASDLNAFDQKYGVNGSSPTLYSQYGDSSSFLNVYAQVGITSSFTLASSDTSLPPDSYSTYGSDLEISLDVEWAHALAPGAKIDLIEAHDPSSTPDAGAANTSLEYAIDFSKALSGVSLVSMSFAGNEAASEISDSDLSQSGVTFVASSGDNGSYDNGPLSYNTIAGTVTGTGLGGINDSATLAILHVGTANATFTGDFSVVTQVQNITNAAQAGISLRNGSDGSISNATNVSLLVRTGSTGIFQDRGSDGGSTSTVSSGFSAPVGTFLALRRQGIVYSAYTSTNGVNWTFISSTSIPNMSGAVTVDLAGASTTSSNFVSFASTKIYNATVAALAPATSSNVVSVGGTVVSTTVSGSNITISSETSAWGNGVASYLPEGLGGGGTGGGYSTLELTPAYQKAVNSNTYRAVPDVSFDGGTDVAIYDSNANSTFAWYGVHGTSFSAPSWAALIAVANQGRALLGFSSLSSPQTLQDLYGMSTADFNDITSGSNGNYTAATGYDLVTGLGTPKAANIVADLSRAVANGGFEATSLAPSSAIITDWTTTGNVTISTTNTHAGSAYAAHLAANASLSQTLTGLLPDTTYILSAYSNSSTSSGLATLSLSNYGGNTLSASSNATTYTANTLTFTTGPTSTTANITLSQNANGTANFDDISLTTLASADDLGFETGTFTGTNWAFSGATVVTGQGHNGTTYAASLSGSGSYVAQSFSSLLPNTTYVASMEAKLASTGNSAIFVVQAYGGTSQLIDSLNSTTYTQPFITFRTGPNSTTASVELFVTGGAAYADDFNLQQLSTADDLGFESADLSDWTTAGTVTLTTSAIHSGSEAAKVANAANLSQTITGLQPSTAYTAWVYAKVDANSASLTASGFNGSSSASANITATSYTLYPVHFTTGSSATSVTLTLSSASGTSNFAYFDDIDLAPDLILSSSAANISVTNDSSNGTNDVTDGSNSFQMLFPDPRSLILHLTDSNQNITINQSSGNVVVLGGINIQGTGNITLNVSTGSYTAGLTITSGTTVTTSAAFSSTASIVDNGILAFNPTSNITIPATITGTGGLLQNGNGTTTLTGNYTATGPITLSTGNLTFANTTNARGSSGIVIKTSALSIAPTSVLDTTNHDLMIGNSNLTTVNTLILNGFNIGPGGAQITSSNATTNGITFLIPLDATANGISGWDNITVTDPNTIIIKYALFGDATLDGTVDGNDFSVVAGGFGSTTSGTSTIEFSWLAGDVNLDGIVDGNDFSVIAGNFGHAPI